MKIVVEFKSKYGNTLCYPVDDNAKRFASIAGTRTLTPEAIRQIQALGFELEVRPTNFLQEILDATAAEPEPFMLRKQAD